MLLLMPASAAHSEDGVGDREQRQACLDVRVAERVLNGGRNLVGPTPAFASSARRPLLQQGVNLVLEPCDTAPEATQNAATLVLPSAATGSLLLLVAAAKRSGSS